MRHDRRRKLSQIRKRLGNPYAYLNGEGGFDVPDVTGIPRPSLSDRPEVRKKEIEALATALQRELWRNRTIYFGEEVNDPVSVLDPLIAAEAAGAWVELAETLASTGGLETAGLIDREADKIQISRRFPHQVRRFTAAHELGHWFLHKGAVMHRDRPRDGSEPVKRDRLEREADLFAVYFLMPAKLVREQFRSRFGAERVNFTRDVAFFLGIDMDIADKMSVGERARELASTGRYAGHHFASLAEYFGVSVETMALRLIELELIQGSPGHLEGE